MAGVLVALLPIMCPYGIGKIPVNLILTGLFFIIAPNKSGGFLIPRLQCIRIYTFLTVLFSLNGFLQPYPLDSLLLSVFSAIITFIFYTTVFCNSDFDITRKYLYWGGYVCSAVLFYQVACEIMGLPHFTGELPFFNNLIGGWVEVTFGYRFASLFSEPSYYAIYMVPLVVMAIRDKKLLIAWIFGFSIIMSSSSLGIVSLAMCVVYEVLFDIKGKKQKVIGISIIALIGVITFYFVSRTSGMMELIELSQKKFERIEDGDSDIRLIGYISLYNTLPIKELLFGVGLAQMGNYFIGVYNYSNTPVTTLINSGMLGLFALVIFWAQLFFSSYKRRCVIYFLIFIAISFADPLIFSDRYYYLLYFVLFGEKRRQLSIS